MIASPSELRLPDLVESAMHTASVLQVGGNARWAASLGDPGLFGGFQVHAVSAEGAEQEVLFESVLFGGRSFVGTPREVVAAQRAFILSRRRKGSK